MTTIGETLPVATLRARIAGEIVGPGDERWDASRQAYNLTIDQRPDLVALPADASDVVRIVEFAREHGFRIAPQRTGHNAGPLGALNGAILLKTDALQGVEIDPATRRAWVGSGSKWKNLVPRAAELGLVGPHGSSPEVGIVGYALGGGVGWYARTLGLAANNVTAIELVTADGQLRTVDADHDPELFWALRGGGGNFGVVTRLQLQLHPISEVYAGQLFYPWERAAEVLHTWLDWTRTAPENVTSVARLLQLPDFEDIPEMLRNRSFAMVNAVVIGDEAHGAELFEPLRKLAPELDTFGMMSPAGIGDLHLDPPDPAPYASGGQMLGELDSTAIDRFLAAAGPGSGSPLVVADIRHVGGALRRERPDQGSLGTFDAAYLTDIVGLALDDDGHRASRAHLEVVAEAFAPYETGRAYLNFTEEPTDPARFYTPAAWARLRAAKLAYDPGSLIRANHPIPPASEAPER